MATVRLRTAITLRLMAFATYSGSLYDRVMIFRCGKCHSTTAVFTIRCKNCGLEGMLEPASSDTAKPIVMPPPLSAAEKQSLKNKAPQVWRRITTLMPGVDRVLGGTGFATPSVCLLGGGQGCGKSTLCLQIAAGVAQTLGAKAVLYVAIEEPAGDVRARTDRIGLTDQLGDMRIMDTENGAGDLAQLKPVLTDKAIKFVVIDSISVLADSELDTNDAGKNMATRAKWIYENSRADQRSYLLIARLNKENDFHGVRDLQYALDTISRIDRVDGKRNLRKLWCPEKNRCASTDEIAYLVMLGGGFVEVSGMDELVEQKDGG